MQAFEWEACNQKELYVRGLSRRTRLARAIYVLDELPYLHRSGTFVSSYVGSSDPTTQFSRVALRKQLAVAATAYLSGEGCSFAFRREAD